MDIKISNSCQFCNKKSTRLILFLGYQPTVNDYNLHKSHNQKLFPMSLVKCDNCELFQLREIINNKILFPKSYPYTSSTTKILRENFEDLARKIFKNKFISKDEIILDIGSNDGNLLSNFLNKTKVLGITPENIGKKALAKGIPTIIDYFNNKTSNLIKKKYGKCKIITATNVFAHINDINNVLSNIKNILKKDGLFISENHYFLDLIQTLQYDTIYHEHLRYYTITHLKKLFYKNNMEIFDVQKIKTHGGSIRVFASRKGAFKIKKSVRNILIKEKKILNNNNIEKFKFKVYESRQKLLNILLKLKKKRKLVMGVGAPSRSTTLIHFSGINSDLCKYIFEIEGSHKIGKFVPANDIKIISENSIKSLKPDYLIIFSWHIYKTLIKNLKKKGFRGKFIIPLPSPRILS
tara:strand:- start:1385 stop:2608 length:1224 start_codon:yes stop_codon:yes gene_type:complete